jgi:hypothetical protein
MKKDIFEYFNMDENLGGIYPYRQHQIKSWSTKIPHIKKYVEEKFTDNQIEKIIVEIGVQGGGSLLQTFDLIENKNVKLFGIDIWEKGFWGGRNGLPTDLFTDESLDKVDSLLKECRTNLMNILSIYDRRNQVELINGSSTDHNIISRFDNESIDLLYIDGDHGFQGCYLDLVNWYPKVKIGGCIINDDYGGGDGVKKAVDQFIEDIGEKELVFDGWQTYFTKK